MAFSIFISNPRIKFYLPVSKECMKTCRWFPENICQRSYLGGHTGIA